MILRSGGLPWRRLLTAALAAVAIFIFWTQVSERGDRSAVRETAAADTRVPGSSEPATTKGWGRRAIWRRASRWPQRAGV